MVDINLTGIHDVNTKRLQNGDVEIELIHTFGDKTRITLDGETAGYLAEDLAKEDIETLEDIIFNLERRLAEAEGQRDLYREKYYNRMFNL